MPQRIVINGVEYASPDNMPPSPRAIWDEMQALLADADCDGVPDIVAASGRAKTVTQITTWDSAEAIPEDQRGRIRNMLTESAPSTVGIRVDTFVQGMPPGSLGPFSFRSLLSLVLVSAAIWLLWMMLIR